MRFPRLFLISRAMTVIYSNDQIPVGLNPSALTIGAFDGLHVGHRALITELRSRAQAMGLDSVVVTFDKHPATIVRPASAPKLITDLDSKIELIKSTGVDLVYIIQFDQHRADQSPNDFVIGELVERLRAKIIVVGSDFHFGKDRQGNLEFLGTLGGHYGFELEAIELIPARSRGITEPAIATQAISSTRIRGLLAEGHVELANLLLGRDFFLPGRVVHGDGVGRSQLGYPTANLQVAPDLILPGDGVYYGWSDLDGKTWPTVISLGKRPTYYDRQPSSLLEAHLLGFDQDIYERSIRVAFSGKLRDQRRFDSTEELVKAIEDDVKLAKGHLGLEEIA